MDLNRRPILRPSPKKIDYVFYISKKFDPDKEQFKKLWDLAYRWAEIRKAFNHHVYNDVKVLFTELCCKPDKISSVRSVLAKKELAAIDVRLKILTKGGAVITENAEVSVHKVQVNSMLGRLLQRMVNIFKSSADDKMKKLSELEKKLDQSFGIANFLKMDSKHLFMFSNKFGGRFYHYDIQ